MIINGNNILSEIRTFITSERKALSPTQVGERPYNKC